MKENVSSCRLDNEYGDSASPPDRGVRGDGGRVIFLFVELLRRLEEGR